MDSTGSEIAQLEQNVANPCLVVCFGLWSLHTSWQEKLAKGILCLRPSEDVKMGSFSIGLQA